MGARSTSSHPTTTKADGHLLEYFRQNFGTGGGGTEAPPPAPLQATGGVVSDYTAGSDVYRAHVFTSSSTFNVTSLSIGPQPNAIEYLVVAGGGGTGVSATSDRSGGGGAGGFRTNLPGHPLAGASLTATVQNYTCNSWWWWFSWSSARTGIWWI